MEPNNNTPENLAQPQPPIHPAPPAAQPGSVPYGYPAQSQNPPQAAVYAPLQQPQPTPPKPQPPKPAVPRRGAKTRDLIMGLLIAVLCFAAVDCMIWSQWLGLGFAISTVLLFVAAVRYLKPVWRHTGVYTVSCMLLFLAGCVSLVFSADNGIKTLMLFCLLILYICILMDGMELRAWTSGTFRSCADFFYTAFATSFGKIGAGMYGLFHRDKEEKSKRKSGFGKALLGLLIALPLAVVLIILLSNADEAFHGMLDGISYEKFPEKILSLLLAAPLMILLFCRLFSLQDANREKREESEKGIDPIILTFFLLGVSAVYVLYLFSQLAYFFSGFMGFLPNGFTYAEYARRGFFELSAVSAINIVIVILASAFSRKKEGRLPLGVRLPSLFLCLFSLVITGTEVAKMKMYTDTYGLTRLRILTALFMVFLAIVFLALIVHLFVRKFPYLKVAVIAGVILTITINFVSVDRMVADYNVWAYQTGVLKSVDVATITELGDAAVPALLKLAQDENEEAAKPARQNLFIRWKNLHEKGVWDYTAEQRKTGKLKPYDYRGYNTVSYTARQLLLDNTRVFSNFAQQPK